MSNVAVHPPDPNSPKGMAFVLAAGFPDPRPGNFPNQQLVIIQAWEAASELWWDLGLRYHPELATKWVKGGGQFTCGELVDEKPEEVSLEKSAEEVLEFLGQDNPEFADMLKRIREAGSVEDKKTLAKQLEGNIKDLLKLIEYVGNQ